MKTTIKSISFAIALFMIPATGILHAFHPIQFEITGEADHRDVLPNPWSRFRISWIPPDGKAVTLRETMPDGTVNIIENAFPNIDRSWGSIPGVFSYQAIITENFVTTYVSNVIQIENPNPLQPSLIMEDFEDNNHWSPDLSLGWWDGSSAYIRSNESEEVFSGNISMKVDFDKGGDPWAYFGAYLPSTNYRSVHFNEYDLISFWVKGQASILVKLVDGSGVGQDIATQWVDASDGWKKVIFDYSQLNLVDKNNISTILFFVMPGDASAVGTFYIDELRLERTRPVLIEDFWDTSFWDPIFNVGWWDASGSNVYQRSRIYDGTTPVMHVAYNKNGEAWSLFSAHIAPKNPLRDFSRHSKLTVNVRKGGVEHSEILAKLKDRDGNEEDISVQFLENGNVWRKLVFDYSNLSVDLSNIDNVMFFIDPGNSSSSGSVQFLNISLE